MGEEAVSTRHLIGQFVQVSPIFCWDGAHSYRGRPRTANLHAAVVDRNEHPHTPPDRKPTRRFPTHLNRTYADSSASLAQRGTPRVTKVVACGDRKIADGRFFGADFRSLAIFFVNRKVQVLDLGTFRHPAQTPDQKGTGLSTEFGRYCGLTKCVPGGAALGAKLTSPEYVTVIVCFPGLRLDVLK